MLGAQCRARLTGREAYPLSPSTHLVLPPGPSPTAGQNARRKWELLLTLEVKVSAKIVFLKLRPLDALGPVSALWKC